MFTPPIADPLLNIFESIASPFKGNPLKVVQTLVKVLQDATLPSFPITTRTFPTIVIARMFLLPIAKPDSTIPSLLSSSYL